MDPIVQVHEAQYAEYELIGIVSWVRKVRKRNWLFLRVDV
jgi:hypothetical protein